MVTHSGKEQYLQPTYFSKEMYLHFNLGSLHLLIRLCQEIVADRQKEYIRKLDQCKRFDKLISRNCCSGKFQAETGGKGKTSPGTVEDSDFD